MLVKSVWQQLQDWTGGEESKDATDTIDGAVRGGAWGMKRGEDTPEGRFQGNAWTRQLTGWGSWRRRVTSF